jgi:DNA-binding YbaB/EbfC family protein
MGGFDPKQFQELIAKAQQQAQDLQSQMQKTIVEASSGGGTVTVKMNGQKRLLEVKIEPEAVQSGDVEMLQDLIAAAVNEASRKVDDAMQASVGGMLGGMGLPI